MNEVAVNVPFEATEIIEIAVEEFRKRLQGLSPLSGNKEYSEFSIKFSNTIRLKRSGETPADARETLAWGDATRGEGPFDVELSDESTLESADPNDERMARGMLMTVEGGSTGNKKRRKVRIESD